MTEENAKTEVQTSSEATASTPVAQKSGSKKTILIVVIVLLALCCIGSTIVGFLVYLSSRNFVDQVQQAQNEIIKDINEFDDFGDSNTSDDDHDAPAQRGEVQSTGYFDVSVDNVRKVGKDYEIEMTVTNITGSPQSFSTILYMNLRSEKTDSYPQNLFYGALGDRDILDQEIPAGKSISGVIVYTVNDNPTSLILEVTGGFFVKDTAEFVIL